MQAIDYGHLRDGVLYHGTLSDLDGTLRATWTYEREGKKVSHDQPIDAATFRRLWNGVGKLGVFHKNRVTDPSRQIDPEGYHVISIVFGKPDEARRQLFLVPALEEDAEFQGWLKALNIPVGSRAPKKAAAPAKAKRTPKAAREKAYADFFGKKAKIRRDPDPNGPAIDVYVFEPGEDGRGQKRDFYTLVTGGLSDVPMRTGAEIPFRRAELVLYVPEPRDEHVAMLRWLARLPLVQEGTWYGPGTTMTNGQPPRPIFADSKLDCFLFLPPVVGRDNQLHEELVLDEDPTTLLWVVPITNAECRFILQSSLNEFLSVLDRKQHPFLLNEARGSYVKAKR
jgi:hypothetical protein